MTHYHWILPSKLSLKWRLHYETYLLVDVRSCRGWNIFLCSSKGLPHVRESKTVLDSGFHTVDSSLCQWNLDSGFHLLVGFQIPEAVFWIPNSRIPHSTSKIFPQFRIPEAKISQIPESKFPYRRWKGSVSVSAFIEV